MTDKNDNETTAESGVDSSDLLDNSFAATEIQRLNKQLAECDNHLRNVLIGAAKVSRPSYHDKAAFDRFMHWRDNDCKNAEKWRSLCSDNIEDSHAK